MSNFKKAPEVEAIALELISQFHPHLKDAVDKLDFYKRYGGGVDWAGKCKKCTSFERHLTSKMFFVFINDDVWTRMNSNQREALVDHELCHILRRKGEFINHETREVEFRWANKEDPDNWYIREHDVEEFSDVIYRHGLWETGIEKFAVAVRKASHQMTIEDFENQPLKAVNQ
ncbi:MAG: hypothetical protein VR72_02920 [Clostridiaceae bacterium BRH_c20a]|nr:MAG: hypothetical protein VR72_02920 [Clostridiaceae bacterium BRH_c20a]